MHIIWASFLGVDPVIVHQESKFCPKYNKTEDAGDIHPRKLVPSQSFPQRENDNECRRWQRIKRSHKMSLIYAPFLTPFHFEEVTFSIWLTIIEPNDSLRFPFHRVKERKKQILLHHDRTILTERKMAHLAPHIRLQLPFLHTTFEGRSVQTTGMSTSETPVWVKGLFQISGLEFYCTENKIIKCRRLQRVAQCVLWGWTFRLQSDRKERSCPAALWGHPLQRSQSHGPPHAKLA